MGGGRIVIKDAMTMLNENAEAPEWPCVSVAPGDYIVSLAGGEDGSKSVRICAAGSGEASRGKEIGRVGVDHGAVAMCDYDALLAAVRADLDGYSDWTEDECEAAVWENESGVIEFGGVTVVHVKTGIGDGSFPVFELANGGRVVGMECVFAEK